MESPIAKKVSHVVTIHGDRRVDDYFWMREKTNAEVIAYLESENEYTEAVMADTKPLQEALYNEILARIEETDMAVPARRGPYLYYTRTEEGKQYTIHCRKPVASETEEVLLDENELARGEKYFRLEAIRPSASHNLLAYSVDTEGDEDYTIFVKDLGAGTTLPDRISGSQGAIVWANDNRTFYYATLDAAKRPEKVWRHTLGTPHAPDELVFHETDERFFVSIHKTRSGRFILIDIHSKDTTEVHYAEADRPDGVFQVIDPRRKEHEYHVQDQGEYFFIRTNDGAKNFRLMRAPVANPARENWNEVIAHRPHVKLEGIDAFQDFLALYERENGLLRIRVSESGGSHDVTFDEPAYSVAPLDNFEYDSQTLRFRYTSLVTPSSVFDYDMRTRTRELRKQERVLGGYDPSQYQSERIFATAGDGTQVPISLVYRKGTKNAPLLLYGYGSYGINMEAAFVSSRLSLLDRGFIYAIANIRGGAELGEPWHDQGKMMEKRNTFTDFLAAAEHLIANGYTTSARLAIMGGSAGGLLMGAVLNMRPDLFAAAIAKVPFVDVLNTMLDASLPLTVTEYDEWGDPNQEAAYRYMKSYSPYDNVERRAYPNLLITAGLNDPRVQYWEPAKWAAKLRAVKSDSNTLLLKTNMGSGHFGASGRYERIKETAFDYAFLLKTISR
ncbi:MAG: S9 family peptidase [Bryobacteraceae bacterium]